MALKLSIIFFTVIVGVVTGISVGPVRIVNNQRYITYQLGASEEKSLLECPIKLDGREELQEVSWSFFDTSKIELGTFKWTPEVGGKATGKLVNVVRLDRNDGGLELTKLNYDLGGYYTCSATTTDGKTDETAKWEVLIVDTTANSQASSVTSLESDRCTIESTFKVAPIYPEPTIHSGLYDNTDMNYVEEVRAVEWLKQKYENGSVAYSHGSVLFKIDRNTPKNVSFLDTVGITKSDGNYISLTSGTTYLHDHNKRGCPLIKERAYQDIEYNSNMRTCREEVLPPLNEETPLTARLHCMEGYKPIAGGVEYIMLTCNTNTWTWGTPNDMSASSFTCDVNASILSTTSSSALIMACLLLLRRLQQ